jgi:hypothetical protein
MHLLFIFPTIPLLIWVMLMLRFLQIKYSIRFKMSVVLGFGTQIKKWNEIIIGYNTFTKLPYFIRKRQT